MGMNFLCGLEKQEKRDTTTILQPKSLNIFKQYSKTKELAKRSINQSLIRFLARKQKISQKEFK